MKYGFLLTIDASDNRGDVVKTIRGTGSLLDLIEGRDQEGPVGDTWFNRYVLKPSLLPAGTPELPTIGWVAINKGVPAVVRNEYSQNSTFWKTVERGTSSAPLTRAELQTYLRNLAAQDSVTHYWQIIPGDALTGDLLAHFAPMVI